MASCGGGGSDAPPAPSIPTPVSSQASLVGKTTVNHATGDQNNVTGITAAFETLSSIVTATSLSAYTINNNFGGSMFVQTSGISTPGIATIGAGAGVMKVGGSQFTYSRFGTYLSLVSNTNGTNSQYIERSAPYSLAQVTSSATLTNATYATLGKAVGTLAISNVAKAEVQCDVSVAFSVIGATKRADITLSNCLNNAVSFPVAGTYRIELGSGTVSSQIVSAASLTHVNPVGPVNTTVTFVGFNGYFLLGGPSGQEIVGSLSANGSSTTNAATFNLAFGAKK